MPYSITLDEACVNVQIRPMQQLLAWLFIVSTTLTDARGLHFRRVPDEAARAFVQACAEANLFDEPKLCPAFLLVMGARESGWSLHPNGSNDSGHAAGPFQEWRGGDLRTRDWLTATRHYLGTVAQATRVCPEQFIAPLAGERCGSSVVHVERMRQVRTILAVDMPVMGP